MADKAVPQFKIRVAVVDDEEDMQLLIKDLLERTQDSSCVGCFSNAADALAGLPGLHPDVVLMDIHMPGINGIECAKRLKHEIPQVKVIMVTGIHDPALIGESLQAGAESYLFKPVTPDQCIMAIKLAVAQLHHDRPKGHEFSCKSSTGPVLTAREDKLMECFPEACSTKRPLTIWESLIPAFARFSTRFSKSFMSPTRLKPFPNGAHKNELTLRDCL